MQYLFSGYLLLCGVIVFLAVASQRSLARKSLAFALALAVVTLPVWRGIRKDLEYWVQSGQEHRQVDASERRFLELCKGAGTRIFKTVDGVDSLLLIKVRPEIGLGEFANPMLPGAAMAGDGGGDSFISSFLGVEATDRGTSHGGRGTIFRLLDPSRPHYDHVDAVDPLDGKRYRYRLVQREVNPAPSSTASEKRSMDTVLERKLTSDPAPRYAVDYEDIVDPDDRRLWIAGTIIRVIDQRNQEVLAEYTTYLMDAGMGLTNGTRSPWMHAAHSGRQCPAVDGATDAHTRYFVDQIVRPKRVE